MSDDEMTPCLRATEFLDHESPRIREFVARSVQDSSAGDPVRQVVDLYYAVRDGLFYEVYGADLSRTGLSASSVLAAGQGFCLHKSVLFAAAVRAVGVPSRLVYADVRNHLASDRLKELIGGDVFFHSLTSVYLGGRWLRATPVFNELLCRLYGMPALDFDGVTDSQYHPYDSSQETSAQMEFLKEHGEFDDLPYEFVMSSMRLLHPRFLDGLSTVAGGSLATEANSHA
ncbi:MULTISPECIES: transglutaminase-like domain-containing protein [Streptomyces]|uniref:transglutaminase-like domain-containing protein n=1 Tax=Streptomyces TaxID=1883 RepID=UPI001E4F5C2F|nr:MULTISPECIES: transglutaminase-like domain-containing protein [Streptomyces]MCD7443073.1 transglutaminase-like domain-containing protein [Streptomyces lincolnensis]WLW51676.1 transglutaminase-like domain-containing protein [Streptomyces coralus]